MATQIGADSATAHFEYGTVYWRTHWWAAIRNEVSTDYKTTIFGPGYALFPWLFDLAGRDTEMEGTRSPHSIFYFTLGYSGFVGVAIFFWLEISVILLLWRVYKVTGATFGLIFFIYTLIGAFFGNSIETPQGAIPLYLFCGMAIGPMLMQTDQVYDDEEPVPIHVAEMV